MANEKVVIGETPNGYVVSREEDGVGGYRYWYDEMGIPVVLLDTSIIPLDALEIAINDVKNNVLGA